MNVVSRCKVYSLDQFTSPYQYTCEVDGKKCARIHVVQETLRGNDKTRTIVNTVRKQCEGNGLILNISSMPWNDHNDLHETYPEFQQTNLSMLQFDSFIQFMSQLCTDPVTALSRCQPQNSETSTSKQLAWVLIDNLSHLSMDPKFDAKLLNRSIRLVQQTFGSVVISTSLPLSFHGGIESTFKHQSTKCASGDRLLPYFNESDIIL
ncbi:Psy3 [Kluyveromyces lactis]|nr:Psy3 [Kluyveromyces lactis]